ncbi:MAG: hypothetical protein EA352_07830 [Gemmatimonadales bacterium]|nr:MAG: hypothetical protein EA352_07830 [Gemmatimonadales bacterium]
MAGCLVVWKEADSADRAPRLSDLGLGLVLPAEQGVPQGRLPVLDLGSLRERTADAGGPLSVLGRVPDSVARRLRLDSAGREGADSPDVDPRGALGQVASLLSGLEFGPAVRPVFLRMAMRDIVRDVDLHDRTAVRISLPTGGVARALLDTGALELHLDTSCLPGDVGLQVLEAAVRSAFSAHPVYRDRMGGGRTTTRLRVRLPEPRNAGELRLLMAGLREGLVAVLAACEPARHRSLVQSLDTFGPRDSLSLLPGSGQERVH